MKNVVNIRVNYPNGTISDITAKPGETLMDAIPNLFGDCGGNCVCATCHVKILSEHKVEHIDDFAEFTLDLANNVEYNSRLSCQIVLGPEHDGLNVEIIE